MVNVVIPYKNINKAVSSLYIRSISTMLREINIILKAINGEIKAYQNHPITLMWKDHKDELITYQQLLFIEYIDRTFNELRYRILCRQIEPLDYDLQMLQNFVNSFDDEYFMLQRQHLRYKSLGYKTDWYEKQFPDDETRQGYKVLINEEWVYYPKVI